MGITNIIEELKEYLAYSQCKQAFYTRKVEDRLQKSLESYYADLSLNLDYIDRRLDTDEKLLRITKKIF